ncbi:MAG: arsenite efflux transporter metallochaperone ArsD [Polyangiaceae bacterium]|nr:arsenite efflux transporter metallochaperone ArsD [Polyangiaceae bacterium]
MTAVRVFDPAMCCPTGICGPSIDPALLQFAADLDWLAAEGVSVERFNLAQQPGAFAEDAAVKAALETRGEASLPLVKVNGEVKSSGVYPTRAELAAWAGVSAPAPRETAARAPSALRARAGDCCGSSTSGGDAKKSGCC